MVSGKERKGNDEGMNGRSNGPAVEKEGKRVKKNGRFKSVFKLGCPPFI